jgi:hypothetical protein
MRGEVCRCVEHSTWQAEPLFYIRQITFADCKYLSNGSCVGTNCYVIPIRGWMTGVQLLPGAGISSSPPPRPFIEMILNFRTRVTVVAEGDSSYPWIVAVKSRGTDGGGPALYGVGLLPLDCWDRRFESRWGHGCSSLVFVVCCVGSGLCDKLITNPFRWVHGVFVWLCVI